MDNNKPTIPPAPPVSPAPPQPTAAPTPAATSSATPTTVSAPNTGGMGKKMLIIGVVILVVLAAGGVFWFMSKSKSNQTPVAQAPLPAATTQPTAAPQTTDQIEQSLNSDSIPSADSDLNSIDQDLQSL